MLLYSESLTNCLSWLPVIFLLYLCEYLSDKHYDKLCNSQLLMACLNVTDCRLNCVLWVKGESSNRVKVNSITMGKDYCYLNESLNKKVWFYPTYLINLYPVLQHVLATCNIFFATAFLYPSFYFLSKQ